MSTALINVCQGDCCREFYLPKDWYWKRRTSGQKPYEDGDQIREMAVRLKGRAHTCKHFADNRCGIYAQRPMMCRAYPYGQVCDLSDHCSYSMDDFGTARAVRMLEWLVRFLNGERAVQMDA
jgi:Fe-S-cluster containining protein